MYHVSIHTHANRPLQRTTSFHLHFFFLPSPHSATTVYLSTWLPERQFIDSKMGTDSSHLGFLYSAANFRPSLAHTKDKLSPFVPLKWKLRPHVGLKQAQRLDVFIHSQGTFKHNKFLSSTRKTTEIPSRIGKLPLIFSGKRKISAIGAGFQWEVMSMAVFPMGF